MNRGFSLAEILVAISIFGIFVVLFFNFFETNRNSYETVLASNKAIYLAKEGIEATRNIRDKNFSDLVNGTWGLSTSSNKWQLNGSSNDFDGFVREIIISEIDSKTKKIESKVSYDILGENKTFSLFNYLTYWQEFYQNIGNWASILKDGSVSFTGGIKVAYSGNYAYVITGSVLRVFDITNTSSPVLLPTSYTQSGTLTNIFVNGNYVFMTSTNNNQEVQIRNISNPNSLGATIIVNLPSNNDANGIFVTGNNAYVARNSAAGVANFTVLAISVLPSAPTTLGSLTITGENLFEIYGSGNYVYVSSSGDASELRILDISNVNSITSTATNLTGGSGGAATTDNAGAVSGEGNYLYIEQGNSTSTVFLFNISTPNAPAQVDKISFGGKVNDISAGNGGHYAWLGTNLENQELIVLEGSLSPSTLTVLGSFNATSSQSFLGVSYHSLLDRLIAVSNYISEGFIILKPN